jgi:hypothetical protein
MAFSVGHAPVHSVTNATSSYAPDILPLLQTTLSALADIDFAHEKSLDRVRQGDVCDAEKDAMIARLRQQHRDVRAPFIRELTILRERIDATFR